MLDVCRRGYERGDFPMSKAARYAELVVQRKACRFCSGHLTNASVIDGGSLDCEEIGAYSQWQGNLNSELMVVGQDFADVDGFRKCGGWPGERVETNENLRKMMVEAGITIQSPRVGISDDALFFTNAILCMKRGGMQGKIPRRCARECG